MFTGLRPGEKLYEELYFDGEQRLPTGHPKVFCAMHRPAELGTIEGVYEDIADVIDEAGDVVRAKLRELVPEYVSNAVEATSAVSKRIHAK